MTKYPEASPSIKQFFKKDGKDLRNPIQSTAAQEFV